MQGLQEWTNLNAHGCLLIEKYTSPSSCIVRIDDGRPEKLSLSLSPPHREYPGCIHQLFHYWYLHPSTGFPPVFSISSVRSSRRMNVRGGAPPWFGPFMVDMDERLTGPSTGQLTHSILDPRPSHSHFRIHQLSYAGKFHLWMLPLQSPHVSSVGSSMRMGKFHLERMNV